METKKHGKVNIYKGSILTCDAKNTVARYLVESKGRILFVGQVLPKEYSGLQVEDLGRKALVPSFVDTHLHFASFALFNAGLNVMEVHSNVEMLELIGEAVRTGNGKILIGFGASPHSVEERTFPSRSQLDAASNGKPVFIVTYDGHSCLVNKAMIDRLPDSVRILRGYDEPGGIMSQEAFFAVTDFITKGIPTLDLVRNMQKAIDDLAAQGIGMIHTASGVGFPKDLDVDMERWIGKSAESGFQIRLFFQTLEVEKVLKRKLPRIGGCFATALDGCFGTKDAALNSPYSNNPTSTGILYYTDEAVENFCKKANRLGLQIELHAIGDAAFDQATRALKAALDDFPRKDHRHGIIHACLPTAEGMRICAEYDIHIPLQTSFINWKQEPERYLRDLLGEREPKLNPLRDFMKAGISFSAGSDAPCTSPDPMQWIHNACSHPVPGQSLTVAEALRMCTWHGCRVSFDEMERGSLEVGKMADMVILSENPHNVPLEELNQVRVQRLLLAGKPYEKQRQSIPVLLLKGIFGKRKV